MTAADVQPLLDRVVDELRTHGWCQRVFTDPAGRHCITGAADLRLRSDAEYYAAMDEVERRAGVPPTTFNDAPGRTLDDVLALLAPREGAAL